MGTPFFNLKHKWQNQTGDSFKVDIILNNFWHNEEKKSSDPYSKIELLYPFTESSQSDRGTLMIQIKMFCLFLQTAMRDKLMTQLIENTQSFERS